MHWTISLDGGPRRVNHAAIAVGDKIYTFGGYCNGENYKEYDNIDVHILDTVALRWKVCNYGPYDRTMPFKRYGHTVVASGNLIYLWGGRNDDESCNRLFCFDTVTLTWSTPKVWGTIPEGRDGHSACIINHIMYIFAGYLGGQSDQYTQEIEALNLKTFKWRYIAAWGNKPVYCDFHTATLFNELMYVWGGRQVAGGWHDITLQESYDNKMYTFDPITSHWSEVQTLGPTPIGRRSHSCVLYKNRMYIFGGYNSHENEHYNDLHIFDPTTNIWRRTFPGGVGPSRRRRQAFCLVADRFFLFGGTSPRPGYVNTPSDNEDGGEDGGDEIEEMERKLMDHGDLHVLDVAPSLRTLSCVKVIEYNMDTSELPQTLQITIKSMTTPYSIRPIQNAG